MLSFTRSLFGSLSYPQCSSEAIKKNGSIHKVNKNMNPSFRQFVENPTNKINLEDTKECVRLLLERVFLEGICRVFDISMSWLLDFILWTHENPFL